MDEDVAALSRERELVAGLRRGERGAFDAVYDELRPRVFGFVARLCGNRAQAEDLLQETFVRLARSAESFDEDTRLRPLLFTIARNLFIDHRRRALLDFDRLRELSLGPSRPRQVDVTPFDIAEASETQRRLEDALLALPTKYKEAVLLVSVEGFEPKEAAAMLNIEATALRQRLARGRKMLRAMLEDQ